MIFSSLDKSVMILGSPCHGLVIELLIEVNPQEVRGVPPGQQPPCGGRIHAGLFSVSVVGRIAGVRVFLFPQLAGVEIARVAPQQVDLSAHTLPPLPPVGAQESPSWDLGQFPPGLASRGGGGGGGW